MSKKQNKKQINIILVYNHISMTNDVASYSLNGFSKYEAKNCLQHTLFFFFFLALIQNKCRKKVENRLQMHTNSVLNIRPKILYYLNAVMLQKLFVSNYFI